VAADARLLFPDGAEYRLSGGIAIGRDEDNDLVLAEKSVSRHHAVIRRAGERWFLEDRGSFNGTILNQDRIPPGKPLPLRHADRIQIGARVLVFSSPAEQADTSRTEELEQAGPTYARELSPLQRQVVQSLCAGWLEGGSLDRLPSNEEIAAELGTPGAVETVKAALRRAYAKAGVTDLPPHAKRRALCRAARQRGWI
jgi:pSer/pThr/pTyr-binding forkhead associated (FHA) protein